MKKFFSFIVLLSMVAFTTSAQNSKDVNADGLVDIGDVTSIIDCLLNPSSADSYRFISINGDSIMDVTDVSFLIDFILSAPTSGTIQSLMVSLSRWWQWKAAPSLWVLHPNKVHIIIIVNDLHIKLPFLRFG